MNHRHTPISADCALNLRGFGVARADLAAIATLRKSIPAWAPPDTPGHFLKHADEQTVLAVAAMDQAISASRLQPDGYRDWTIVAAPRFIGRVAGVATLDRFARGGGPAISPHLIPQHSLHSVSGALSILLASRQPNFGVGGTGESLSEGLLAALTLPLANCAGVWLVATSWEPEPQLDDQGRCQNSPVCHAVALAFESAAQKQTCGKLRLLAQSGPTESQGAIRRIDSAAALCQALAAPAPGVPACHFAWDLPWGAVMVLETREGVVSQAKAALPIQSQGCVSMDKCAVVITGVGAATPLGSDLATFSANLLAGKSAAQVVTDEQAGVQVQLPICLADDPPVPAGWEASAFQAIRRSERFVLWCAASALADAGYQAERSGLRIGLALGSGGELLRRWEGNWTAGGREVHSGQTESPTLAEAAAKMLCLTGPCCTVAAACASANYAIAQARRWITLGLADVCLAGGVETVTPICRAAFNNLRALSRRTDAPEKASRPFDADRDGFVMGEGAGLLVLESAERARRRGARIYAEIAGFGASSDAFHMIIPSSDPVPAAAAMRMALDDAGIQPREVDYVNAHATSTPVGDKGEARALKAVFGGHTARIPVSSTKSMTGHLLSAAAAVEALACLAAIENQRIPPTINLDTPDPECDLCHVPHQSIEHPVRIALSNSFGFGGSNTTLVLRKAA